MQSSIPTSPNSSIGSVGEELSAKLVSTRRVLAILLLIYTLRLLRCRFGFHNGSSIDSLLDKDDVSLEAIMDEEDVLQECKAQNTRLIDYFQRVDVLKRLIGHVTGQIESEEQGRYKCVLII